MCTSFKISTKDGSVVIGRTMEFPRDVRSQVTVFPRNMQHQSIGPGNVHGFSWRGKYGIVGMNNIGIDTVLDGINEAGLSFGALYMPDIPVYQGIPSNTEPEKVLSQLYGIGKYLLSMCSTVQEVKTTLQEVIVWGATALGSFNIIGLHFTVHDATGASIVIEYIDGSLKTYDNPLGVLTNSPTFDQQLSHLAQYDQNPRISISKEAFFNGSDAPSTSEHSIDTSTIKSDLSSSSRFIRAVALTKSVTPAESIDDAVIQAFHIINNFDVPKGLIKQSEGDAAVLETTQWVAVSDLASKRYYVRYYDRPSILQVDLSKVDFTRDGPTHLDTGASWVIDISER